MTNTWMNEDGEPIMDAAAWRFEQQLDMEAQADYMEDHFYDSDAYADDECSDEEHDCDSCEGPGRSSLVWQCSYCGRPCAEGVHDQGEETFAASYNPTTGQWDYTV